jgi:hypothetical protein
VASFFQALDAGEPLDPQGWLKRHPGLTEKLKAFLAAQEQLDRLAQPLRTTPPGPEEALPRRRLRGARRDRPGRDGAAERATPLTPAAVSGPRSVHRQRMSLSASCPGLQTQTDEQRRSGRPCGSAYLLWDLPSRSITFLPVVPRRGCEKGSAAGSRGWSAAALWLGANCKTNVAAALPAAIYCFSFPGTSLFSLTTWRTSFSRSLP